MHTILGINGTAGPGLAHELLRQNLSVRGVSRRAFSLSGAAPSDRWQHIQADLLDPRQLRDAVRGSEVVYLLVGMKYDIDVWRRDWPALMQTTVDACVDAGAKLVFLDNVYSYGLVDGVMTEATPYNPNSRKGEVRVRVANLLHDAVRQRGLRACIARAADFYGPDCLTSMLNEVVFKRHAAGQKALWMGDPKKVHTFTYSHDLGPALATLGTDARADGEVWHVPTTAERLTGHDWVRLSAEQAGVKPGLMATPTWMLRIMGLFNPLMREMVEMNYQNTHDYIFSSEKFERTFGQKATDPRTGASETMAWYRAPAPAAMVV
jgi:nucleoside-diphosphate-sugar epimerase